MAEWAPDGAFKKAIAYDIILSLNYFIQYNNL